MAKKFLVVTNDMQARFMARYNPDAQYTVCLVDKSEHEMYLFNGKYYQSPGWYADKDSIVKVEKL